MYNDNTITDRQLQYFKDKYCNDPREIITINPDDILYDVSSNGRARPWRDKKMANELLAKAYDSVNPRKAERLRDCAKLLQFKVYKDGRKQLKTMSSCRVRLCPLCTWRRSLKVYHNTCKIVDYLNANKGYNYIFLTLTVRNCYGDELSSTIDNLMAAWDRLMRLKAVDKACKGYLRSLEVTHNVDRDSSSFDTYHPHYHCLLAVNPSYFTSRDYLSQAKWTALWRQSLRVDYDPVVDVRRCYGTDANAISECAKYACKSEDFIIADDWDLTVNTVQILDKALDSRRLVSYGGSLKEVHKLLNLDDELDGDLVAVGDDESDSEQDYTIHTYWWYSGYRQYARID